MRSAPRRANFGFRDRAIGSVGIGAGLPLGPKFEGRRLGGDQRRLDQPQEVMTGHNDRLKVMTRVRRYS